MKKYIFTTFAVLSATLTFAQAPQTFKYQAIARDNAGDPLQIQDVSFRISILQGDETGPSQYTETHDATTNQFGLVNLGIGDGNLVSGDFESIQWWDDEFFLKIELDENGGTNYEEMGIAQLLSVPYALHAATAQSLASESTDVWQFNGSDIHATPPGGVGINTNAPAADLDVLGNLKVTDSTYGGFVHAFVDPIDGNGIIETYGPNGFSNIALSHPVGLPDYGSIACHDNVGETKASLGNSDSGYGFMYTRGPELYSIAQLGTLNGYPNNGYITVTDANQTPQAGIYLDSSGDGIVYGDVKNFRMEHPEQPGKEIWYASLEGPEAGAYARGTATLVNGTVTVNLPDHFRLVASDEGLTVMLTPLSADSKGLAVVQKSKSEFTVVELMNGVGDYSFDWEMKCVRAGYEDYQVIRDARDCQLAKCGEMANPVEDIKR